MRRKTGIPPLVKHIRRVYRAEQDKLFNRGRIDAATHKRRIGLIMSGEVRKGPEFVPIYSHKIKVGEEILSSKSYLGARSNIRELAKQVLEGKPEQKTILVPWLEFWELSVVLKLRHKIHPLQADAELIIIPRHIIKREQRRKDRAAAKLGNVEPPFKLFPDSLNPAECAGADKLPAKTQFEPLHETNTPCSISISQLLTESHQVRLKNPARERIG